jgi:FdrA protein
MRVSADVRQADGVHAALIAMATELNLDLLAEMGFRRPPGAQPDHLLIAVRASDGAALSGALADVDTALSARSAGGRGLAHHEAGQPPRTTAAAVRASGPGLALISVPGRYAFAEAMDALDAGCDVMIFSDNVPVEQEVTLKKTAAQRDLIVMGPDCGTAIVGGIGLGFSHTLAAGPVGLVAASGTGAQQVLCLLDHAGAGVSAVIGVGGRDLSAAVGGRSARAALAMLSADPGTELIIVVSKPPAAAVAAQLRGFADGLTTPVRFALVAPGEPDLTAATDAALRELGLPVPDWPRWPGLAGPGRAGALRGLFAGGTLCDEAMVIATERLGQVWSNTPLRPELRVAARAPTATGHVMIDFGDDELTAGRAHPMIDQSLRLERLAAEASDPGVSVVLLDVVLGHGAHPDPAAELGPAIAAARANGRVAVVVSLIGAASDPQDPARQARVLQAAGAHVFASNSAAARFACDLAAGVR